MKLFDSDKQSAENLTDTESLDLSLADGSSQPVRRGPPNRMNDLTYTEWMKFQKSFFRHTSNQELVEQFIYFFTKSVWPNGETSRSLVVGVENFDSSSVQATRLVTNEPEAADVAERLGQKASAGDKYDFVLVDLRRLIRNTENLSTFLRDAANRLFESLSKILIAQRYCAVLVATEERGGKGFPLPWSVALASRNHLRLRDEKIGLLEAEGNVYYCLIMQAEQDERPLAMLTPENLSTTEPTQNIPAWLIPKPPPRKKHEVLHPAKYPETLVKEFVQTFTKPGEIVFDPMVGTGSTIVAAVQTDRRGIGVELKQEFAEIAERRLHDAMPMSLFERDSTSVVLQGDSARLLEIAELKEISFDYAITSPPYWSMLANPGSENQENRRKKNLPLVYSDSEHDLGNVADYDEFLSLLESVYFQVAEKLADGGFLTVVVKNVKRNHILYPLAWDLTIRLCGDKGKFDYAGTTLWCQDDVGLKPFAVGIHWVSNILHHYCLHFRRR